MQSQETATIETPVGKASVVIRGYITGRMKQQIQQVFLDASTMDVNGASTFDGSVALAATNKALELIVISVNGSKENVLDQVLDMHGDDYDFIKAEVDKVQSPLPEKTAKSSGTASTTPSTET